MSKKQKESKTQDAVEQIADEQTDRESPTEEVMAPGLEQEPIAGDVKETVEGQLQKDLETAREEASRKHELYLRSMAEMENLRKRCQREKEDVAKFGNESILREILPVIDNLERAVDHAVQDGATDGLLEGVRMTLDQFSKVLEKFNVVAVEAVGTAFDPALHQAMGQMETEEYPANTVAQEMQRGYLLNDRLLRPSLVMVAKAPPEQQVEAADQADTDKD